MGISFFYLPAASMAWGVLGHRIVGQIASTYLTPKAKAAIGKILGNESIAMASNWGDFIKSDPTYDSISAWHYVDIEPGLSKEAVIDFLNKDTAVDAYTKINFLVKQLKNGQLPAAKKQFYLKILIHLVEDIHQPLHVGRHEDMGGNKLKVSWFTMPSNLHRMWDEGLINFQELSYTEYAAAINFTTPLQRKEMQQKNLKAWIYDSYQVVDKIYAGIQPDEKLSYQYNYKFIAIVNQQLLKGGIHLASVLNEIFG